MNPEQIKLRIEAIVLELVELRDSIGIDEPTMPPDAIRRLSEGVCLFCKKKINANESVSRGCHSRCDQKIRRAIREGQTTDEAAVAKGQWAPKQPGGRRSENPFFSPDYGLRDFVADVVSEFKISKDESSDTVAGQSEIAANTKHHRAKKSGKTPNTSAGKKSS